MIEFEDIKRQTGNKREAIIINDSINFIKIRGIDNNYEKLLDHGAINQNHTNDFVRNTIINTKENIHDQFRDTLRVLNSFRNKSNIVVFISMGRSGTVFLWNIFEVIQNCKGFHHIAFPISGFLISEMFYRGILGRYDNIEDKGYPGKSLSFFYDIYTRSRIVELLHSSIGLSGIFNHWDSWFSPLIFRLFPTAKFVYLKRDPTDTISSHLSSTMKSNRENNLDTFLEKIVFEEKTLLDVKSTSNCLPLDVFYDKKNSRLAFHKPKICRLDELIWHYRVTENLSKSIQTFVPENQYHEVSFEKLFGKNQTEFEAFVNFLNLPEKGREFMYKNLENKVNSKRKLLNENDYEKLKHIIEDRYNTYQSI